MTLLYSFGFNAFKQTSVNSDSTSIKEPICTRNIRVLFASWETTLLVKDSGEMVVWGFKPNWFNKILQQKSQISQVFGTIDTCIGLLDTQGVLTCMTPNDSSFTISNVKEAIYHQKNIYVLLNDSVVQKYDIDGTIIDSHLLNQVQFLCGSNTHVLFSTSSSNTPLYGMGSNKLCQLGFDTFQQQQDVVTEPVNIDYFNELGIISNMNCGSFHSAIVLNGDVYTFGWRKDGKLGWGEEEEGEDVIRCATFLDNNNESIEVNVIKVVCGTLHTLVLDDQHTVWSCGSNKYHQLGRETPLDHDMYFRRCTLFINENVIDIWAGNWNTFILK